MIIGIDTDEFYPIYYIYKDNIPSHCKRYSIPDEDEQKILLLIKSYKESFDSMKSLGKSIHSYFRETIGVNL